MKLFISYGHPQAAICRKICDALRDRGHQVWFDETHIPHGSDWRAEIVNGIITSEGVLSMIDRHSVRDPGVCLDEMSIAIGVRGGNIRYILLEKQAVAEPPASMTTRQWLDMSDWREHENDQEWFDSKMEFLIQMVESKENQEFAGIIDELRRKLPMCHVSTSKQDSLLHQPFIGRTWVKSRVDAWLDNPDGTKICFVYGDPGIGKSTFAAHYTHYNGRVAAAIFCDYNNTQFNHPRSVIQTLAFLLACRLPDYRISLMDALDHGNDLGLYNESELFDLLLAQPLSVGTVDGNRETMCILIDGLDESGDRDRNVLTEVLTKYADRLPKWLRILTFSRKVEIITGLSGGADTIDLTGGLEENKTDVWAYFDYCLSARFDGDANYTAMIDRLSENSGGIFLYATLMADALAKGKLSIEDTGSVPDGLDSAFYRWFQWFFPDIREYEKNWQMALACIAASPEPIPEDEIKIVFDWTNTKLNKLKHTLEVLLRKDVNDFKKDTLQLSHRYISEWLFSDAAGRYQLDRNDAFREMGAVFLEIFKDDPKQLTEYEAYYLRDYVNTMPRKKNIELLLDGKLHGIVIEYGDYAKTWSRYETAMKYYALSEELALAESDEKTGFDRIKRYGYSLRREGDIYKKLGKINKALLLYQKALELSERIGIERGKLDDLMELSASYNKVAGIYLIMSGHAEALELYQKAKVLSEAIVPIRGTTDDLCNLSITYDGMAYIYEHQDRYDEALDMKQKTIELREKVAADRGNFEDYRDLSINYAEAGDIYCMPRLKRYEESMEMYRKAANLCETLVTGLESYDNIRWLCIIYKKTARVYEKTNKPEESLQLYQKAVQLFKKLAMERGMVDDLKGLSIIYKNAAKQYENLNHNEEAMELYQKSATLCERISMERGTLDDMRDLFIIYENIADLFEKKCHYKEALDLYREAKKLCEIVHKESLRLDDIRELSELCKKIARICKKQNRNEEASRNLDMAEIIDKENAPFFSLCYRSIGK